MDHRTVLQAALAIAVSVVIAVSLFGFVGEEWGDAGELVFCVALLSLIVLQAAYRRFRHGRREPAAIVEAPAELRR
ncbi:hypothetical protein [Dermatobacter hominis]|uniref:hypothetical protein n=1 Tax=Dermatobacter hominis TaxID=2884263 RepID=UPI001D11FACA|nr:hypothetical protein [Dermatobacter hominis]UDY35533.1 hypothetical protein LH044_19655 [Dermatobacter hominis]